LYSFLMLFGLTNGLIVGCPPPVYLDDRAILAHADRGPHADLRLAAEHVVGHLQRDGQDVPVGEGILAGPLEAVKGAVRVGEERVAAHADEQPDAAGLDGLCVGVEADRGAGDEHLAGGLGLASLGAGGVVGGPGLLAVLELGEHERERGVGLRVCVRVDVDPVDPVGVEFRFHQERRHRAHACRVRFRSMIRTVVPGSPGFAKTNRSVKSRLASSPGNLRLAAL
jgi:hypothetical protein